MGNSEWFSFKPFNFNNVIIAISHFSSQTWGVDGIPSSAIVKALARHGQHTNVFLAIWKKSNIVPLKNSKASSSPSDFRPIALLWFLSKVLDKIAYSQLMEHWDLKNTRQKANWLLRIQFHRNGLTSTNGRHKNRHEQKTNENSSFHFSKLFDPILPSPFLWKLILNGFCRATFMWIISYFEGRTQRVSSNFSGESAILMAQYQLRSPTGFKTKIFVVLSLHQGPEGDHRPFGYSTLSICRSSASLLSNLAR